VRRGSEGRFRKGVVVSHPWLGVRGFNPQSVEHCLNSRRFKRCAFIAMQDGLILIGGDAERKRASRESFAMSA